MIVVDTNVLAYLLIGGDRSSEAESLLLDDCEWHAPILWRSEFRNVLAVFERKGKLETAHSDILLEDAHLLLHDREHLVESGAVMDCIRRSPCSAYDCEFVVLAENLGVSLVTEDRQVLRAFPSIARSMTEYLANSGSADSQ